MSQLQDPPLGPAQGYVRLLDYPQIAAIAGNTPIMCCDPATGQTYWTTVSAIVAGAPGGTVTSVAAGVGLVATPSPIVGAGSIALDETGLTQHGVMIAPAAGQKLASLSALGSVGQVLTSNGPGIDPSFQGLPAAGSLVKISSTVVNPSAASVTLALPAGYSSFTVKGRSINMNGSGSLAFRCGFGAGPTIDTASNYGWIGYSQRDGATALHPNAEVAITSAKLGEFGFPQASGGQQGSFTLEILNPNDAAFIKSFYGYMAGSNGAGSGYFASAFTCNWLNATDVMTAIQFGQFSANQFTGTFDLYGWV